VRAEENGSQEIGKPQVVRLASAPDRYPADIATTTFEEEKAILDRQKKFDESEPLYYRALAIFERAYGWEHYASLLQKINR
jgi:hypothetical protein